MAPAAVDLKWIAIIAVTVVAWLFCMYTTAELGRSNGQSYGLWVTIGFLTGPFGLAFAFIYFRLTGERHRRMRYGVGGKSDLPEIIRCPQCGQSVPSAFECCQFCGSPIHGRR